MKRLAALALAGLISCAGLPKPAIEHEIQLESIIACVPYKGGIALGFDLNGDDVVDVAAAYDIIGEYAPGCYAIKLVDVLKSNGKQNRETPYNSRLTRWEKKLREHRRSFNKRPQTISSIIRQ